jgi:hypothetical protein
MFNLFAKRQEKKSDFEIEDDDDEQGFLCKWNNFHCLFKTLNRFCFSQVTAS